MRRDEHTLLTNECTQVVTKAETKRALRTKARKCANCLVIVSPTIYKVIASFEQLFTTKKYLDMLHSKQIWSGLPKKARRI